ncbi:MAG TPA: TIGR04222 domain-containing membrane protein [Gemmataceae bacterium]|nr:TIGR04222 domain-containing membrane protein [Gemmataceae bacterium]
MTPDRAALLDRIQSFDIDGVPSPALPFAARLARENGWSRPYAERVIREYKRFVFLTVTAGFPVCPSEDVDAAWHLHLTYTRCYWKRFCGEVLGQPLHHEPTRGGPAEAKKHLAMYDRTLAAYREAFGEEPPADIWPPAEVRFGEDLRHRVVNTARNWVIPKAPVKRVAQLTAAGVVLAAFVPGCAGGGLNPFNLVGTDFLYFLIPVMLAAVCVGRLIRSNMRSPDPEPGDEDLEFTWEQAAYLAGGYPRLTTAAIARLVESGAAELSASGTRVVPTSLPGAGPGLTPVETAVLNALPVGNTAADLKPLQEALEAKFSVDAARLETKGFTLPMAWQYAIGATAVIPHLLVILCLGLPRLMMGMSSGKPVGYLGATLIIGGLMGLVMVLAGSTRLSRRGEAVLANLRAKHANLKAGDDRSAGNAGLAVALFGTAVLAGLGMATLGSWFPRQTGEGSSSGCGSGCGSGDGGGGCGGGCGGCGGGD